MPTWLKILLGVGALVLIVMIWSGQTEAAAAIVKAIFGGAWHFFTNFGKFLGSLAE